MPGWGGKEQDGAAEPNVSAAGSAWLPTCFASQAAAKRLPGRLLSQAGPRDSNGQSGGAGAIPTTIPLGGLS